jgi:AcrR family transcriptional regulator
MSATPRPRGRRPAGADTRGEILAAARAELAERGYAAASLRAVARRAEVDPSLVRHYFDDKADLFAASLVPEGMDPAVLVPQLLAGGPDGLGERVVRAVIEIWDVRGGESFRAAFAAMTSSEPHMRAMAQYLDRAVFARVAAGLDEHGPLRMTLVFTQMMGVLVARYVLRQEPLASLPGEGVAALVGPTIQAYLTGPVPAAELIRQGLALEPPEVEDSPHGE